MILALVLAKAESSRLPGKNMALINGVPLFVHAVRYAKASQLTDRIVVTTDSDEIARIAVAEGAEVVRRGPALCGDASNADVIDHAIGSIPNLDAKALEYVVCLQPDNPNRAVPLDDVLGYASRQEADILLSVYRDGSLGGSFRLYSARALRGCHHMVAHTMLDDCINIHTVNDLNRARSAMRDWSEP